MRKYKAIGVILRRGREHPGFVSGAREVNVDYTNLCRVNTG
jgi:hypothetical protein